MNNPPHWLRLKIGHFVLRALGLEGVNVDSPTASERIPPHSIEAETCVLGGVLRDNFVWKWVNSLLTVEHFYCHKHRLIYAALGQLIDAKALADAVTVFEHLKNQGKAREVGGFGYINSLAQQVPHLHNIRRYAEIVRECSFLRKLSSTGDEIATSALNPQGKAVDEILGEAVERITHIGEECLPKKESFQSMDQLAVELLDRIQEKAENPDDITGVSTGFYDLDRMTSGLQAGDLILLAARPSMGKTALAINIAEHVAVHEGLPVAMFSMEMGASQLAVRVLGSIGRIDQLHLRTGKLTDEEWSLLSEAMEKLHRMPLHVDETPDITVSTLRANARRLTQQCGKLGLIVVDNLQLMGISSSMTGESRATAMDEIARGLKMLARELQCPVLALSLVDSGVEHRADKRPRVSDLRGLDDGGQSADVILLLHCEDENFEGKDAATCVAEVIVGKQRCGPTGTVKFSFFKSISKFENLAPSPVQTSFLDQLFASGSGQDSISG